MTGLRYPLRRIVGTAVLALFALLGVGLVLAAPASAHATVEASSPADGSRLQSAPKTVTITFDESVGITGVGYLHVTNQHGRRVDAKPAFHPASDGAKVTDQLQPGLGDGTYTASFRVVSADSHPVAGTIRFVVGDGALTRGSVGTGGGSDSVTSAFFDVARWVSYAGIALLGGSWLLLTVWPGGRHHRRAVRLVWTGWGLAASGAVLETLVEGPFTAGSSLAHMFDASLLDDTLHNAYGVLHCVRLLLLAALALALGRGLQPSRQPSRQPTTTTTTTTTAALSLVLGLGVTTTFASSGHAATTDPTWLSVPGDALHVAAMGSWLGGLVMLLAAVLPHAEPDELSTVLPVFSRVAFVSVMVLAVTGTYQAWHGIGSLDAIFHTNYGLLVDGKILLFIALLALGNLSRMTVQRRTVAYAMTDAALVDTDDGQTASNDDVPAVRDPRSIERLRRSVYVEVVVGMVVLALTSVLVAQPRGRESLAAQYREPVSATAPLNGGHQATVTVDPGAHGNVGVTVTLDGVTAQSVTATATQQSAQIGPLPIKLTRGGGSYSGSVTLPVAGAWRFDLVVAQSSVDATTTDTTLTLH